MVGHWECGVGALPCGRPPSGGRKALPLRPPPNSLEPGLFDKLLGDGIVGKFCIRLHAHFIHQTRPVCADRLVA